MLATMEPKQVMEVASVNRGTFIKAKLIENSGQAQDLILANGLLLREYKGAGYFKEEGYGSFDEAIEAMKEHGQLDYGARTARHMIAVVDMVEALGISAEEVKRLGISKLREIATVKDSKQQLALLGEAGQKSVGEIQKAAKALRDKAAGRETDPLDPVTLMMTETQRGFYKECIEKARMIAGLSDDVPEAAVLVDVICAEFMSGATN
jgi:hypothetical protein